MQQGLTALGVGVGQFCSSQDPQEGFMEVVVFELGLKDESDLLSRRELAWGWHSWQKLAASEEIWKLVKSGSFEGTQGVLSLNSGVLTGRSMR